MATPTEGRTFSFVCEWDYCGQPRGTVEHRTDAEQIHEVVEAFERFLRGCGFEFSGHVVLVEDDAL